MVDVLGRWGIGRELTEGSLCLCSNLITNKSISEWLDDKYCEEDTSHEEERCKADELHICESSLPRGPEVDAPPFKDDINHYRGESPWEEQSSCIDLLNYLSDGDCLALGRDLTSLKWLFERCCMGYKCDLACSWIMHRIIVYEHGHSKDIHWQIGRHDEEDALRIIISYREQVVLAIDFNPLLAEHEIKWRVIAVTRCEYEAILEGPGCNLGDSSHHFRHEWLVIERWNH